jgi:hypothetical protein
MQEFNKTLNGATKPMHVNCIKHGVNSNHIPGPNTRDLNQPGFKNWQDMRMWQILLPIQDKTIG